MEKSDGMNYVPSGRAEPVVGEGAFIFAAAFLDHGHINAQTKGLAEAGGTLRYIYDSEAGRAEALKAKFPTARIVEDFERILEDEEVRLVAAAAIPSQRASIGFRVMKAGKDYFTDKSPFVSLSQLAEARRKTRETGRKYMVYFGERLHNESAWRAGELLQEGIIGRVLQVVNLAPHRLRMEKRRPWFFKKEQYGGILTDIGSHQIEQFLSYTGARDATVNYARVENFAHPEKPELEDFGEVSLTTDNGASCYCRVDWFTPDGQQGWGDGRTFILGSKGTMELRKYLDVGREGSGDLIYLVDEKGEKEIQCSGKIGFPAFGKLILDVLHRTEDFMTQAHAFKAAEISMQAQELADRARRQRFLHG